MKFLKTALVTSGLIFAMLFPGAASAAVVTWYDGDTTIYQSIYYFDSDRTVSYSPYGIAIYKYDGPPMLWVTHDCVGNDNGYSVVVPDDDPSGWVTLKPNDPNYGNNFTFCLAIQNYGSLPEDSFYAMMEWDGTN